MSKTAHDLGSRKGMAIVGKMKRDATRIKPIESGAIFLKLMDDVLAANFSSWHVIGEKNKLPSKIQYRFYDGTMIEWSRPAGRAAWGNVARETD